MREKGLSLGAGAIVMVASLVILTNTGVLGITWPWEKVDIPNPLTKETFVVQPEEATIVEIEPIALDCRARIHAQVPVEGKRDHRLLGQTYRTDTVSMVAVGDIDTCVDASAASIVRMGDAAFQVIIPASAITFERPRVDTVATVDSVVIDKGLVGKFTDVFPWVSEDSGLTPSAYAFAQEVVGSSECMERAWVVTESVIKLAYRDQMVANGGDAADITVDILGEPRFGDVPNGERDGFDFSVGEAGVACRVDAEAYTADILAESPDA